MKRETYRGVALKVQKGREWGYLRYTVNGVCLGDWMGMDEDKALESLRGTVDAAQDDDRGGRNYSDEWYAKERAS